MPNQEGMAAEGWVGKADVDLSAEEVERVGRRANCAEGDESQ
jgi:hypothetical protein